MNLIKFMFGGFIWHLRAGAWYFFLVFRLYFAIGLDRSVHPGKDEDMSRHFKCPYPRTYRQHLSMNPSK